MSPDLCVLVSTRPDIIKMTPVVRAIAERGIEFSLLHSGQHYSRNMDDVFFEQLELREPDHRIPTKRDTTHAQQTAHILEQSEAYLEETDASLLLTYGDTNSTLAGALAARKTGVAVGHVEAGLRSDDWRMPEEHNRVMVDHISDLLFAPTRDAAENLREDNVKGTVDVTGNPIVDVVHSVLETLPDAAPTGEGYDLAAGEYALVTCHREENVDDRETLEGIVEALRSVQRQFNLELLYPVHPRTQERIREFGLDLSGITLVDPVGYPEFLHFERDARLVLTDSGGVQEEACILGTPCVTIRETTERPETVDVGANVVAGTTTESIVEAVGTRLEASREWSQPFGSRGVGDRIVDRSVAFLS